MNFGILTLATKKDYQKAIGLALSARLTNPGVPLAAVCTEELKPLLAPYYDKIVIEDPTLRGFVHKIHLDRYTPFEETFFFDSDVLLFRNLNEVLPGFRGQPYRANGIYVTGGRSDFGQDRNKVLEKIKRDKMVCIDGAGHAYFKMPEATKIFELAREITYHYQDYAGDIKFADEDVMNIAMTLLDYEPYMDFQFFSRHMSAKKGTMKMNAAQGKCEFIAQLNGQFQRPHMMHFACREAPFPYVDQLKKLFRHFKVPTKGLDSMAFNDFYATEIDWKVKDFAKKILGKKK